MLVISSLLLSMAVLAASEDVVEGGDEILLIPVMEVESPIHKRTVIGYEKKAVMPFSGGELSLLAHEDIPGMYGKRSFEGMFGKRAPKTMPFSGGMYGKRGAPMPFSGGFYGKRSGRTARSPMFSGGFYG